MAVRKFTFQFTVKAESMEDAYDKLDEMLGNVIRKENGVASKVSQVDEEKDDRYFIELAREELGSAVRDNPRDTLIEIGKKIDDGTWDDEE